eukprot:TRINITY_DN3608_c1_g1_i2.p1 TRINITY_DN3608_c1_g1~~TRINITY_DN3608_c1_g1_i2.p1  ORF type:complete len:878 (+),score=72.97 TRINITY_DN3608_c1_g1_i2:7096-9729(+)
MAECEWRKKSLLFKFVKIGSKQSKADSAAATKLPAAHGTTSNVKNGFTASSKSMAVLAGLEGHPEGMRQYAGRSIMANTTLRASDPKYARYSSFNMADRQIDQLCINGEMKSFRLDDLSEETTVIMENPDYPRLGNSKVARLQMRKPRSSETLSPRPLSDVAGRVSQSFTFGDETQKTVGASKSAFNYESVELPSPRQRMSLDRNSRRRASFNLGPNARQKQQPIAVSPRLSTEGRHSGQYTPRQLGLPQDYLQGQELIESLAGSDGTATRKLSTRDKYLQAEDSHNLWNMDPAQQLKDQLQSMLVSNPEIEKRIQDVIKEQVDLATTTKQLEVQKDVTGAYCLNQYIMIKTLGQGAIGKVKLCYNTVDKNLYAVKMIDRKRLNKQFRKGRSLRKSAKNQAQENADSEFLREIAVLKKLEHHNIVNLHEVIDPVDESQPLMLVMEYLEGGPVVRQLKDRSGIQFQKLSEDFALEYFRMMCKGLDYLHYNRIVHGDLKPENLLIHGKGELKIADFGCARIMAVDSNLDRNNRYGTPSFRAPEMLSGESYDPFNADIWAMGVCLYVMVFGKLPFSGDSENDIYEAIKTQPLEFPENEDVSEELLNLLTKILVKDPLKRITLYDIMYHDWVTERGQMQLIPLMQMTQPPNRVQVSSIEEDTAIVENNNMVNMDFEERVFQDGEYLIKCGDTSSVLYFILSGAVEVKDPQTRQMNDDLRFSLTLERDDSMMFDSCILEEEEDDDAPEIYLDNQRTAEITQRVKQNALEKQGIEFIREVKGPANIIGDISICYPVRPFPYNVQARGEVRALELTSYRLQHALMSVYDQHAKKVLSVFTGNELSGPNTPSITPRRGRRTARSNPSSFSSVSSSALQYFSPRTG